MHFIRHYPAIFFVFSGTRFAQTRVACVGDSITAGWKLKEAEKYVTKLGGLLGAGYDVQNFGHSAYSMMKLADKSCWDSPMFQAAQDYMPNIVTIMLGTNDAHPDYWPQYESQYYQDYLDMIAVFKTIPSSPKVIVLGLPYLKPGGRYDGVVALDALLPGVATDAGVNYDDDCDRKTDCEDSDCTSHPDCQNACNNDGVCVAGEDCDNCANDCDGKSRGRPSERYCCGNGIQESAENDGRCDGNY